MPINIAARRGAKAQKRKAAVAEKRKAETLASSLAGRVRLAAHNPIRHCLITGGASQSGLGMVVLARGTTSYQVDVATFLIDPFARGIRDVIYRSMNKAQFDEHMEVLSGLEAITESKPADARKLLHDLAAWSAAEGFAPHPNYRKVEPLFGSVDAGSSDAVFEFGIEGRPVLVVDDPDELDDWDDADIDMELEADELVSGVVE